MNQAKSERLMNLVICLLVSRGYVPKSRIRQVVGGYGEQSTEAFERMFERDKEELRELGIPIETGSFDPFGDEEPGYRIKRQEFELPEITLEPDEAAVIGLAARVWQHASLAEATSRAVLKLRAAGVETDTSVLAAVEPRVAVEEPAFWPLWEAVRDRRPVTFSYRKSSGAPAVRRRLQPWSVLSWHGRWYVVGHDLTRDGPRLFRLSRIVDEVEPAGEPGSYEVPSPDEVRGAAGALAPPRQTASARVRARQGSGFGLRRRAAVARVGADGWDELSVPYADAGMLAEELAGYGADVVAIEPDDVRKRVVERLRAVAGEEAA
ncbi:MAG TPA: WYL domain-containing protein [Jiangellaceae bacterium]|nr:WYL domain-containing protein [Jiangellaceae bacterium]